MKRTSIKCWLALALVITLQGCAKEDIEARKPSKADIAMEKIAEEARAAVEVLTADDDVTYDANGELADTWIQTEKISQGPASKQPAPVPPEQAQVSGPAWMERALWIALCIIAVMATYIVTSKRSSQGEKE